MLNLATQKVLRQLNAISDKVILKYPVTTISSESSEILVNVDMQALDSEQFDNLGIFELSKLLKLLSLFDENPSITADNEKITITSSDNTDSAVYLLADEFTLKPYEKPANIVESTANFPSVAEFDLSSEEISKISKAYSIFSDLDGLEFNAIDGNTTLKLVLNNKYAISSNSYSKSYFNSSSKNFNIRIKTELFNKIPVTNYKVKVVYNEVKDAYRLVFITDVFKIVIAILRQD